MGASKPDLIPRLAAIGDPEPWLDVLVDGVPEYQASVEGLLRAAALPYSACLVSATFLTLFVLPTVYAFVYRREEAGVPPFSVEEAG